MFSSDDAKRLSIQEAALTDGVNRRDSDPTLGSGSLLAHDHIRLVPGHGPVVLCLSAARPVGPRSRAAPASSLPLLHRSSP